MNNLFKPNNHLKFFAFRFDSYSTKGLNPNLRLLLETMPKQQKHIADAQKQRKKLKDKFSRYVPGRISLQVLGTGAPGAPRSLYVFSDQSRYLFNCGEGTQRLAHEHKMKLAKLEHIFITQATWSNIGGLPGTALTIQDVGVPQITLHGPKGLEQIFSATRRFVIIRDLQIKMAECNERTSYQDNVMTVHYVLITKKSDKAETTEDNDENGLCKATQSRCDSVDAETSTRRERNRHRRASKSHSPSPVREVVDDNVDYYAHELSEKRQQSPARTAESRLLELKESKERSVCMNYVCKLRSRPGMLNLEKCVKLGVPSGPLLGQLKMGHDVTLPSGQVIKSKDVCDPDDPGPVFLVVDCPSEEYLDSFVNNAVFKGQQKFAEKDESAAYLVVHFTPQYVMDNPRYRRWIDNFSPSTHHLVLNETNTCMGSIAVHRVQHKLNLLHNTIFPLLADKGTKGENREDAPPQLKRLKTDNGHLESNRHVNVQLESLSMESSSSWSPPPLVTYASTFCNFHLRPRRGLDRTSELKLTPAEYVEETMNTEGISESLFELQTLLKEKAKDLKVHQYPRLLFLGTGSCIPNKTRNTSGILLETSEHTNILIDCGEGTYGQIVRFFGHERANHVLANIKGIFVSHLHADHHIGLIGLLQGRRRALDRLNRGNFYPALLLAPKQILAWLNFYDKYFENICKEFELVPNGDLLLNEQTLYEGTKARVYMTLGMFEISTTHVRHCPNAFGVAFTHMNGYKICYSGDTMPSENLINLGLNCDLLIHEATMEDELEHEAVVKMHSTTSQAIEIGRNMNAKHILLTHFSQRYAKLPRFNDNFTDNVGIAFDNMRVRLDELPLVPLFYPTLKLMFAEHYEQLENKALKRQLKAERQQERASSSLVNEPLR